MRLASIIPIIPLILISAISCKRIPPDVRHALKLAGKNEKELQLVIDNYQKPKDSLKLKAAYFLIGNMTNKYYYPYNNAQQHHISFLDSLLLEDEKLKLMQSEEEFLKSRKKLHSLIIPKWEKQKEKYGMYKMSLRRDLNSVTAEMLIENIDYAFKAWEKVPWSHYYTFEEFCEYILPYRTLHDIPGFWRKELYEKFSYILKFRTQ